MDTKDILRFSTILESQFGKVVSIKKRLQYDKIIHNLDDLLSYEDRLNNHYKKMSFCDRLKLKFAQLPMPNIEECLIQNLIETIQNAKDAIRQYSPQKMEAASYYYNQIVGLQKMFGEENVCFSIQNKSITCVTKEVVLEGVNFGTYEIMVSVGDLTNQIDNSYIRVCSLDDTYSVRDEEVCHPHVRSGRVCFGSHAISCKIAIEECDLLGLFDITNNILHTYNDRSPFISVESWEDDLTLCDGCECEISNEEYSSCENGCHSRLCDECYSFCNKCQNSYCLNCSDSCVCCEEYYCTECLYACEECGTSHLCDSCTEVCDNCEESVCETCLHDTQLMKLCKSCAKNIIFCCVDCDKEMVKNDIVTCLCGTIICHDCKKVCKEHDEIMCVACNDTCCKEE